jgi:hypothetical protein
VLVIHPGAHYHCNQTQNIIGADMLAEATGSKPRRSSCNEYIQVLITTVTRHKMSSAPTCSRRQPGQNRGGARAMFTPRCTFPLQPGTKCPRRRYGRGGIGVKTGEELVPCIHPGAHYHCNQAQNVLGADMFAEATGLKQQRSSGNVYTQVHITTVTGLKMTSAPTCSRRQRGQNRGGARAMYTPRCTLPL